MGGEDEEVSVGTKEGGGGEEAAEEEEEEEGEEEEEEEENRLEEVPVERFRPPANADDGSGSTSLPLPLDTTLDFLTPIIDLVNYAPEMVANSGLEISYRPRQRHSHRAAAGGGAPPALSGRPPRPGPASPCRPMTGRCGVAAGCLPPKGYAAAAPPVGGGGAGLPAEAAAC